MINNIPSSETNRFESQFHNPPVETGTLGASQDKFRGMLGARTVLAAEISLPFSLTEGTMIDALKRGNPRKDLLAPQAERFFEEEGTA